MPEGAGAIFGEPEKREDGEVIALQEEQDDCDTCNNRTLYFVTPPLPEEGMGASTSEERRALSRLPILAIFHGISHERGVPPSFTSKSRTYTLSSLPLSLCSMRAHQVSCDSGRHCPPSASSLLRECSLYLMSKTRTAMSSPA